MITGEYKDINALNLKLSEYNFSTIIAGENRLIAELRAEANKAFIAQCISTLCLAIIVGVVIVVYARRHRK